MSCGTKNSATWLDYSDSEVDPGGLLVEEFMRSEVSVALEGANKMRSIATIVRSIGQKGKKPDAKPTEEPQ